MKKMEIYIHIPFCIKKCNYCDFLSFVLPETVQDKYMETLCKEIVEKSSLYNEYSVVSVFIGGGTPSVVHPKWIKQIMFLITSKYKLEENAEITIEMNPGTVNEEKLRIYFESGINRLSIGLQSTNREELKILGRIHSYEEFEEMYYLARKIGFDNINIDLISALPNQTITDYRKTIEKITSLNPMPEHISAYSLIIEPGTLFYEQEEEGVLKLPSEEDERIMYDDTEILLSKKNFVRYEISNYAKIGKECKHNIGYWRRINYIGFGLGASSLFENIRFKNSGNLEEYMDGSYKNQSQKDILSNKEQIEEYMFLGLRLMEGISYKEFKNIFHKEIDEYYGNVIEKNVNKKFLEITNDIDKKIKLTKKGIDFSNQVMSEFLFS